MDGAAMDGPGGSEVAAKIASAGTGKKNRPRNMTPRQVVQANPNGNQQTNYVETGSRGQNKSTTDTNDAAKNSQGKKQKQKQSKGQSSTADEAKPSPEASSTQNKEQRKPVVPSKDVNNKKSKNAKGQNANKSSVMATPASTNGRWWSKLRDVDPITLVPLSSLKEPPFELSVDNSDVRHWFDSKALAHYLLSTGNFVDPINRQEMTRDDCIRLDSHLKHYGNAELAKCTEMLDLQNRIHFRPDNNVANDAAVANLRREAGVIASHLFHYPSLRDDIAQRRDDRRSQRNASRTGAGAVIVTDDDDQWQSMLPLEVEDDFPEMPIVRRRTREDDFPPIGRAAGEQQPMSVPRPSQPSVSWASVAETARTRTIQIDSRVNASAELEDPNVLSWRASAERPKLNLVKLESTWTPPVESASRPASIFGKARPVDNAHVFAPDVSNYANQMVNGVTSGEYVCPYTPRLLRSAKYFGLTWVSVQEKKFRELVDAGTSRKVLQLEAMPEPRRRFLQELAIRFWGLHVVEMDPEPYRFLEFSATPVSFAPDMTLHKALAMFPDLANVEYSTMTSSNGILFIGCPSSVTVARVHDLMRDVLQARESEYDISLLNGLRIDEKNVFVEVTSNERARKLYKKLASSPVQGFRYRKVEWWPCGVEWAKHQVRNILKTKADELEPLRAQKRLDEKRHNDEVLATSAMTAWDDDYNADDKKIKEMRAKLAEQVDWDDDEGNVDEDSGAESSSDDD